MCFPSFSLMFDGGTSVSFLFFFFFIWAENRIVGRDSELFTKNLQTVIFNSTNYRYRLQTGCIYAPNVISQYLAAVDVFIVAVVLSTNRPSLWWTIGRKHYCYNKYVYRRQTLLREMDPLGKYFSQEPLLFAYLSEKLHSLYCPPFFQWEITFMTSCLFSQSLSSF